MVVVTYADALAALRAECGEPTFERRFTPTKRGAAWVVDRDGASGIARGLVLQQDGGRLLIAGSWWPHTVSWLLAGARVTDAPLTPLADAVRDAGAWLRGRG